MARRLHLPKRVGSKGRALGRIERLGGAVQSQVRALAHVGAIESRHVCAVGSRRFEKVEMVAHEAIDAALLLREQLASEEQGPGPWVFPLRPRRALPGREFGDSDHVRYVRVE